MNIVKDRCAAAIDHFFTTAKGKKGRIEICWDGQKFTVIKEIIENHKEFTHEEQHETQKTYP